MIKKIIQGIAIMALLLFVPLSLIPPVEAATIPTWNTTGDYTVDMEYLGSNYSHDMSLTQDNLGNITGSGGSPAGAQVYTWTITSGSVSGNTIDFLANYTATSDAVTPQTVLHMSGTIANDGTISGTWSDNYQGVIRNGSWHTTSGVALPLGTLTAQDFGVVNYNTGLGQLAGYTAGFGLTDNTLAGTTSVVVKLYSGSTLLQTNTAIIPKFNTDITGSQFSSPFDVSGNFDYATDGYWTNIKESQYGQSVPATRIVATVTLENGKVVTAENTNLVGDATTIYPVNSAPVISGIPSSPVTTPELATYSFDANATDSTIPAQTLSFSLSGAPNGAVIDPTTGVFTWTPSEAQGPGTYTFTVMVSDGSLTDSEALTINVTEIPDEIITSPQSKDDCKKGGWKLFTSPSFKNQGQCVSSIVSHR